MIENDNPQVEGASVNPPDLSSTGEARQRAISSGSQAYLIAKTLEDNNRERNDVAAKVSKKYNGGLPFSKSDLQNAESDWRNNFPTGFMASIVDRVIPEPVQVIDSARYLTSASLSDGSPEAAEKTEFFREKVTKAIRSWNRWKSFNYSLWTEDVLHGAAIVACLDPFTPWPELFRLDEAFLVEGAGQFAEDQQVAAFKKDYLIHEFVDFIKDKSAADDAGWDTEAAIEEVNGALPESTINDQGNAQAQSRKYEDAIREGNTGASHSGARVVETYHTLAVEPDTKKVTHYITSRRDEHKTLFQKDDRFENMSDVMALFTLQPGNGKFYSSKGLGRVLLNIHIAIERARNAMFDQLYISGFKILKTDATQVPQVQLRVRHPFVLVSSNATVEAEQIQANVDEFIKADQQLSRWAEQAVGSYITGLTDTADPNKGKTATESQIEANRDNQARIAFLARAWGQFADMIGMITRRLCDPETTDEIAKKLQKQLKEEGGLSDEDIKELANAPAAEVVQDLTQTQNAQIVQAFTVLRGDPNIDQHRLYDRYIAALVNPQFSSDILLDEQGLQAKEAEGVRQQIIEDVAIMNGESVPVSPRDPHEIHMKVALSELKNAAPGIAQNPHPQLLDNANAALVHISAHLAMWKQQGAKPEATKPYEQALKQFDDGLTKLAQHLKDNPPQAPEAPLQAPDGQGGSGQPEGEENGSSELEPHLLKITSSIAYKDAPDDIKRQIEAAAGFKPSQIGAEGNSTLTRANLGHVQQVTAAKAPSAQVPMPQPPQQPAAQPQIPEQTPHPEPQQTQNIS